MDQEQVCWIPSAAPAKSCFNRCVCVCVCLHHSCGCPCPSTHAHVLCVSLELHMLGEVCEAICFLFFRHMTQLVLRQGRRDLLTLSGSDPDRIHSLDRCSVHKSFHGPVTLTALKLAAEGCRICPGLCFISALAGNKHPLPFFVHLYKHPSALTPHLFACLTELYVCTVLAD